MTSPYTSWSEKKSKSNPHTQTHAYQFTAQNEVPLNHDLYVYIQFIGMLLYTPECDTDGQANAQPSINNYTFSARF